MNYDATELEFIEHVNGFDIRFNDKDRYEYVVFHPSFNGKWIDAFQTYTDAKDFCNEEDVEYWYKDFLEDWK